MDNKEILQFCLEKGLLLDKEVLKLFNENSDSETAKLILEKIKNYTSKRIITRDLFNQNREQVNEFFLTLPKENQRRSEKLKIKLGLSIEISRSRIDDLPERTAFSNEKSKQKLKENFVNASLLNSGLGKPLVVQDFVKYFRGRINEMRDILQDHSELSSLVSINKIHGNKHNISIIGMVFDKRVTKNKNIILDVEDLTGRIKVLINKDKKELYENAEDIALDSVIGLKGSGSREILFVDDIVFPESMLPERKKAFVEEYALFIGDLHYGSKLFLEENFLKFIDYLNGNVPNTPEVNKIKYLFVVGDLVTGVGNYPNQEMDLKVIDLEEQFLGLANLLGKIRKDIKIIISPGNHDCVRLMEPQPVFDEKYAWPLYDISNVIITTNPSYINIAKREGFAGFEVLTYHGFSFFYYVNNVPKLMLEKAANAPEKIMKYLLKQRHLAPTHGSHQYFPMEKDPFLIKNVPDIFVSGHTHKSAIAYYNNILVISISGWESMTDYMEKVGSKPDFCKVPMFNLKTREVKILDFE